MMKLHGTPPTRAVRVQWLLQELGIPYEMIEVDVMGGGLDEPGFRRLNPAGKIPVLVDGDTVMTESAAIPLWLAERDPDRRFIPADIDERGQMYRWLFFLMTEIEAPLWRSVLHEVIYPEDRRIAAEIANARRDVLAMLAVFEAHMANRIHVVGDRMTVADFNAAYLMDWARYNNMLDDCPALTAFVERMYARPNAPMTLAQGFEALAEGDAGR
jgi:glutathione S-transferase